MSFQLFNIRLLGVELLDKLPASSLRFDKRVWSVGGVNDAPVNGVFDKEHSIPKFNARLVCDQIRSFFIKQNPASQMRRPKQPVHLMRLMDMLSQVAGFKDCSRSLLGCLVSGRLGS